MKIFIWQPKISGKSIPPELVFLNFGAHPSDYIVHRSIKVFYSCKAKKNKKKTVESEHQSTARPHQSAEFALESADFHIKVTPPPRC